VSFFFVWRLEVFGYATEPFFHVGTLFSPFRTPVAFAAASRNYCLAKVFPRVSFETIILDTCGALLSPNIPCSVKSLSLLFSSLYQFMSGCYRLLPLSLPCLWPNGMLGRVEDPFRGALSCSLKVSQETSDPSLRMSPDRCVNLKPLRRSKNFLRGQREEGHFSLPKSHEELSQIPLRFSL